MNKSEWITVEILKGLVSYDPLTGVFTDLRTKRAMSIAKSTKTMYLRKTDGKYTQLSPGKCAWMLMKSEMPPELVRTKVPGNYQWHNLYCRGGQCAQEPSEMPWAAAVQHLEKEIAELKEIAKKLEERIQQCQKSL